MRTFFCALFLLAATGASGADLIIGGVTQYTVQKGDRLELIGARLGVFWKNIAKENNLDPLVKIPPGQQLKVTTRKIVPRVVEDGIIINVADRTLYLFKKGKLTVYPVGLGLPAETDFGDWRSPIGKFTIVDKRKNPTWYVPESIQMENAAKGKPVEESVPPGPKNPLGRFALKTSLPGVLIHETIYPASVYRYQSHGCIRVMPENMEKLFEEVDRGTKGELIYVPVKLAVVDGKAYLEVRTDTYRKLASLREHAWKLIGERGLSGKVDAARVDQMIKEQTGIAEDIMPRPPVEQVAHKKDFFQRVFEFFRSRPRKNA
jgi:L,D-transpeptidase ErfK/SrfK